jgi:hypothetical protein
MNAGARLSARPTRVRSVWSVQSVIFRLDYFTPSYPGNLSPSKKSARARGKEDEIMEMDFH